MRFSVASQQRSDLSARPTRGNRKVTATRGSYEDRQEVSIKAMQKDAVTNMCDSFIGGLTRTRSATPTKNERSSKIKCSSYHLTWIVQRVGVSCIAWLDVMVEFTHSITHRSEWVGMERSHSCKKHNNHRAQVSGAHGTKDNRKRKDKRSWALSLRRNVRTAGKVMIDCKIGSVWYRRREEK